MKTSLKNKSPEELIQLFASYCIEQDNALLKDQIARFNQLYNKMAATAAELKSRVPDARVRLVSLFDHPNTQVRLQAARMSLAVAPKEARDVIEVIAKSKVMPQAGDAGMTLWCLDCGVFVPE
jgi:hypothetical protein